MKLLKMIKLSSLALFGTLLFAGCTNYYTYNVVQNRAIVSTINNSDDTYGFMHIEQNNNQRFNFQMLAVTTLKSGYRYFSIEMPSFISSQMISSPEEYKKLCYDGFSNNCIYFGEFVSYYGDWYSQIKMYKSKPAEFFTFDAQEVISYLKANNEYIDISTNVENWEHSDWKGEELFQSTKDIQGFYPSSNL